MPADPGKGPSLLFVGPNVGAVSGPVEGSPGPASFLGRRGGPAVCRGLRRRIFAGSCGLDRPPGNFPSAGGEGGHLLSEPFQQAAAQRYAPAYGGAAAGLPGAARPPDETRLLSLGRSPILTVISAAPFLHTHGPHVPAQSSVRIFPFFDFVCSRTTRIKPNSQNAAGPPAAFLISTQRKTGQPMVDRFGGCGGWT